VGNQDLTAARIKMAVFLVVCWMFTDVSDVLAATIIREMFGARTGRQSSSSRGLVCSSHLALNYSH
jgi:hypothetical protein